MRIITLEAECDIPFPLPIRPAPSERRARNLGVRSSSIWDRGPGPAASRQPPTANNRIIIATANIATNRQSTMHLHLPVHWRTLMTPKLLPPWSLGRGRLLAILFSALLFLSPMVPVSPPRGAAACPPDQTTPHSSKAFLRSCGIPAHYSWACPVIHQWDVARSVLGNTCTLIRR